MRNVPTFSASSERRVDAFEAADLKGGECHDLLVEATEIMYGAWRANGREDAGTCVLGAGIEVWVVEPRARAAKPRVVIGQVSQGNVSSHAAAKPALEFLLAQGIEARWFDGRMD